MFVPYCTSLAIAQTRWTPRRFRIKANAAYAGVRHCRLPSPGIGRPATAGAPPASRMNFLCGAQETAHRKNNRRTILCSIIKANIMPTLLKVLKIIVKSRSALLQQAIFLNIRPDHVVSVIFSSGCPQSTLSKQQNLSRF